MRVKMCLSFFVIFSLIAINNACDTGIDPADDPNNIVRPCPNYDLRCIQDFISGHAKCEVVTGTVPDPYHYKGYRMQVPTSNMTLDFNDVQVRGLNGDIVEFYVNKCTEKVVMAITVQNLSFYSPDVVARYNRKCKEPIVLRDLVDCVYGPATFTIVLPFDLKLSKASVFTYIENCNPRFVLGSGLFSSTDPTVQVAFPKFIYSLSTAIQEKFVTQGRIFVNTIFEKTICKFESTSDQQQS